MAAYTIALPKARVSPLSIEEQASTGCNVRWRILASDIAYATATATDDVLTFTLGTTPTNWIVNRALGNVTTAFAGTPGTATLGVGPTASLLSASWRPLRRVPLGRSRRLRLVRWTST